MVVKYLGHSCFQFEFTNKTILFDPFISANPKASKINADDIKADYIFLSHGHSDHVADVERIARNNDAEIVGTYEVVNWFKNKGLKGIGMNTGGCKQFDFGKVKLVTAIHSSNMPDGSYGANPVGFCVQADECSFYFAGDTALTMDMKLIPMIWPKLDFCILPIGDHFTMGYEDAVIASEFVQCDHVIACHFDTFEPIEVDHHKVKEAFNKKYKQIILPSINESIPISWER